MFYDIRCFHSLHFEDSGLLGSYTAKLVLLPDIFLHRGVQEYHLYLEDAGSRFNRNLFEQPPNFAAQYGQGPK